MTEHEDFKVKDYVGDTRKSAFRKYRDIYYGDASIWYVIQSELVVTLTSGIGGALGLALRSLLYPRLFKQCGRKVVFGRHLTLRHAHKITLGDNVVLDEHCVVDAKGENNEGVVLEDDVYVGRNTIIYCKNGDIHIGRAVNISSNCQVYSSNKLDIGAQTVIAAFVYIMSGGQYDYADRERTFAEQSGMITRGPTSVGPNCWIGAGAVIVDAVTIGEHCVIGAGSVVTGDIPRDSIALGIPARAVKKIGP